MEEEVELLTAGSPRGKRKKGRGTEGERGRKSEGERGRLGDGATGIEN